MVPASFLCIFLYIGPWFLGKMVLENQRLRMLCTNIVRMCEDYGTDSLRLRMLCTNIVRMALAYL